MKPFALLALACGLALCAACAAPAPAPPATGPAAAAGPIARALDQALASGRWDELRIDAECRVDEGFLAATVFGNGVGIWNRQRQFTLPRERVIELLEAFRRAGFAAMSESYGGSGDPKPAADPPPANVGETGVTLLCRVGLLLDGLRKDVLQLEKGRQSPELKKLAEEILAAAGGPGRGGEGAASLDEGLRKLAEGRLAPEVLAVQVNRQSERPDAEEGWILRLAAGVAEVQRYTPGQGYAEPLRLKLTAAEVGKLARRLAEEGVGELPGNLWADRYTDFSVELLDRDRDIQARRFAGMTPETHGDRQRRFDRVFEELDRLRQRVLAEGRPAPAAPAS